MLFLFSTVKDYYSYLTALSIWTIGCVWGYFNLEQFGEESFIRSSIRVGSLVLAILVWQFKSKGTIRSFFGFNRKVLISILFTVVFFFAIYPFVAEVNFLKTKELLPTHWFNWIFGSPIGEEVLFRGILFLGLKNKNKWSSLFISAILFSGFHAPQWLYSETFSGMQCIISHATWFVLGLIFGILTLWTKSILPATVLHVLNNYFALIRPI